MTETVTSFDWIGMLKISGIYIMYFAFYTMLIQTTIITLIRGVSNIFYKEDKGIASEIMATSILWSIFILMNIQI